MVGAVLQRVVLPLLAIGGCVLLVTRLLGALEGRWASCAGWEVRFSVGPDRPPPRPREQRRPPTHPVASRRKIRIIEVSDQYNPRGGRNWNHFEKCQPACGQAGSVRDADVVFAYSGRTSPRRTKPDQIWVATFWESPQHYPARSQDWDYSNSWRRDSTFPHFEMIPPQMVDIMDDSLERLRPNAEWPRKTSWAERRKTSQLMSIWISNCGLDRTQRLGIARDLEREGIGFASFGSCMRNARSNAAGGRWRRRLLETRREREERRLDEEFLRRTAAEPSDKDKDMYDTSSRFLFFYAAENSHCAYYHTEKVYHGLLSGSVPVYVGADTIDKHVPKGSIIKVSDFSSTAALAQHLKSVAADEVEYSKYLHWWQENLKATSPSYVELLQSLRDGPKLEHQCKMCEFFHEHPGRNRHFNKNEVGCGLA